MVVYYGDWKASNEIIRAVRTGILNAVVDRLQMRGFRSLMCVHRVVVQARATGWNARAKLLSPNGPSNSTSISEHTTVKHASQIHQV